MPYKFHLSGTLRGPERERINPFTRKPVMAPTFVMSDEERAAVDVVIAEKKSPGLTFTASDRGIDVLVTGAIEPAIDVLFEIATAGNLVAMNTHEKCDEPVPVVTTDEAAARYGSEAELTTDVGRFLRLLLPGYR